MPAERARGTGMEGERCLRCGPPVRNAFIDACGARVIAHHSPVVGSNDVRSVRRQRRPCHEGLDDAVGLPGAATFAPRLKKSDGYVDWTRSARDIVNLVRGCNPWPGATTRAPGGGLSIWRARALSGSPGTDPGCLVGADGVPAIATGDGLVRPLEVQPDNRRPMRWEDYLRGARLEEEARFTTPSP